MTFEQLSVFVAVAERQHLTHAAAAIGLSPAAVSASIKALEASYNVRLFERVGRGIELNQAGQAFLGEAKAILARANAAALVLSELGGLKRGILEICASQTIASYWLPQKLVHFYQLYPNIELKLNIGNTRMVTQAVLEGTAELGFIEGQMDEPALAVTELAKDQIVVVVAADHPLLKAPPASLAQMLNGLIWVMREQGSGTRSEFERALAAVSMDPAELDIAFTLPSNEAVLSAVIGSRCAAAISGIAAAPMIENGKLVAIDIGLPPRAFLSIKHKERTQSAAARELHQICAQPAFRKIR